MTFLAIILFLFAAWMLLGVFGGILSVGKPRKPVTPGIAAFSSFVGVLFAVTLTIAGVVLLS